jgi:hypothetical protein
VIRREIVGKETVLFVVRPVGGLGWTWSFYLENGRAESNRANLLHTESDAFAAAIVEARRQLGGGDSSASHGFR